MPDVETGYVEVVGFVLAVPFIAVSQNIEEEEALYDNVVLTHAGLLAGVMLPPEKSKAVGDNTLEAVD